MCIASTTRRPCWRSPRRRKAPAANAGRAAQRRPYRDYSQTKSLPPRGRWPAGPEGVVLQSSHRSGEAEQTTSSAPSGHLPLKGKAFGAAGHPIQDCHTPRCTPIAGRPAESRIEASGSAQRAERDASLNSERRPPKNPVLRFPNRNAPASKTSSVICLTSSANATFPIGEGFWVALRRPPCLPISTGRWRKAPAGHPIQDCHTPRCSPITGRPAES